MIAADDLVWPKADFSRVPFAVYTSQEIFEREQERIFHGPVWLYLGLQAEIPNPGDFIQTYAGDTPVVVCRAEDDTIHAFINRCAHRGSLVVRERQGNAKEFMCVYHHWLYNLKGELLGVPFERGVGGKGGMPKDFNKANHGLKMLKVDTYKEAIFGTFSDDVEPLKEYLGPSILGGIDRIFCKPIEILGHMRQRFPSNWKAYIENLNDGFHAGLLHQLPVIFGLHRNTQDTHMDLDEWKRHDYFYVHFGSDTEDMVQEGYSGTTRGDQYDDPMVLADPQFLNYRDEWKDMVSVAGASMFPCFLVAQLSNFLMTRQVRPKAPNEFELYWTAFGYVDDDPELRNIRQQQVTWMGSGGCISIEDSESGVLIHRAIRRSDRDYSVIEMGGVGPIESQDNQMTEVCLRGFWRYYAYLMGYEPVGGWPKGFPPKKAKLPKLVGGRAKANGRRARKAA